MQQNETDNLIAAILDEPEEDAEAEGTTRLRREPAKRRMVRLERERCCAEQIGQLPEPGEDLILLMSGNWHGFDLVGAVLDLARPATVSRLGLATLGFNRTQAQRLAKLIDEGQVQEVVMVVSEIFVERSNGEYHMLRSLLAERDQTMASTRNHAKLLLFEMSDGRRLAAHGSLNLRRCYAYEQMALCHDAELHQFFDGYLDRVVAASSREAAA